MYPSLALYQSMLILLGSDSLGLGITSESQHVHLVKEPFTPETRPAIADLVMADFDGSTPKNTAPGPKPQSLDPATGNSVLDLPPNAGLYLWETTGATNLPQTIYGYVVTDAANAVTYGSGLLPDGPVTLNGINESLLLPRLSITQAQGSLS